MKSTTSLGLLLCVKVIVVLLQTIAIRAYLTGKIPRRIQPETAMASLENSNSMIGVALTREEGKNMKLRKALHADVSLRTIIKPIELPCIAHSDGPDFSRLKDSLLDEPWDYVIVTSPEAARVLASAWDGARMASIKVAAVGKATEKELQDNDIEVVFTPSKAYATTLVEELPVSQACKVLYPASCRAPGTVAEALSERGFNVVRLNTYDTITAGWGKSEQALSQQCKIACFASPSSIHGWLENTDNNKSVFAACIGATSAEACRKLGWEKGTIFYSSGSPGIDGWVHSVRQAVAKLNERSC